MYNPLYTLTNQVFFFIAQAYHKRIPTKHRAFEDDLSGDSVDAWSVWTWYSMWGVVPRISEFLGEISIEYYQTTCSSNQSNVNKKTCRNPNVTQHSRFSFGVNWFVPYPIPVGLMRFKVRLSIIHVAVNILSSHTAVNFVYQYGPNNSWRPIIGK